MINGVSQIPYPINNFYDRNLLMRALPYLVHDRFGQQKPIPQGNTNRIKFRKYGSLTPTTTPLTAGVTPEGNTASVSDIYADVQQYGDYLEVDDFVLDTSPDPVLTEFGGVLGEQAGQSLDIIIRDVLNAGTNVRYADVTSPKANDSRDDVTSSDVIALDEIRLVVETLKINNAPKLTEIVKPDRGYGTTPVGAGFVAIVHPSTTTLLKDLTGWAPVEDYANKAMIMEAEVGKIEEVRFVESTHAKVFEGEGSGGIDVYSTLFLGRDAYGISQIAGRGLQNIIKAVGSGGTSDPLNQRGTTGWKATLAAKVLQQTFMVRLEHAV